MLAHKLLRVSCNLTEAERRSLRATCDDADMFSHVRAMIPFVLSNSAVFRSLTSTHIGVSAPTASVKLLVAYGSAISRARAAALPNQGPFEWGGRHAGQGVPCSYWS